MADWGMSFGTISRNGEKFPSEGTDYITSLRPIFSGQIKDSFALLSDIKFDYHKGDIFYDLFSEKHNISYENSEHVFSTDGYSIFKLPWFKLLLGKDKIKWGPGYHGQLMLSSNPESANMMKLDFEFKNIRFQSFTSKLLSELGNKYMSAHRIEFLLFDRLDLGLSETLVFGNEFAIEYLNPFQLFAISEGITESYSGKANLLESVDLSCRIVDGLQIYGELAVDEARLLVKPLNHWDTIFGILGGFYIADPFSIDDTDLRVEYAFTNQYFYTYHQPLPNYSHLDSSIGHWMGTDADDLWCEIKHRFTDRFQTALSYELERHGEGDMDTPHPTGKGFDDGRWTFLSGVNEYKHSFGINVSYRKIGGYLLGMEYTRSYMKNLDNKRGENGKGNQLTFEISYWY